jgi:glycosyltransferase involved in cell wall biosynthesis
LIIGIDASNIRGGGGLVHLTELLHNADPLKNNFSYIVVWACQSTLDEICDKTWIIKKSNRVFEKGFVIRMLWQWLFMGKQVQREKCSILFIPGGSFVTSFRPIVTMSQNMLPFEWEEIKRYGLSLFFFKLLVLRLISAYSFRKANGIIFLTKNAKDNIISKTKGNYSCTAIVSHGIGDRFYCPPRKQNNIRIYCTDNPIKLLYISPLEPYKHHDNVVKAVSLLRNKGLPLVLDMFGYPSRKFVKNRLCKLMNKYDPESNYLKYHGIIDNKEIHKIYARADISIFASSCENLPITLIESMAAGLPIVSSNMLPMRDILGANCIYFDPLDPNSIAMSLKEMIISDERRTEHSLGSFELSLDYSWEKCAKLTISFINKVADKYRHDNL